LSHATAIERSVVMRTMGTSGDPTLRDDVLAMKRRLVADLARFKGDSDTVKSLHDALCANQTAVAIDLARQLTDEYYSTGL
jgi:hypothetical protein